MANDPKNPRIFPGVSKSALEQVTSAPCPTSFSTSESRAKKVQAADDAADKIQDFNHFCAEVRTHGLGFKKRPEKPVPIKN